MRETVALLRHEKRARIFFLALAQSALGTGAGYVALLLIAEQRFESAWAISLVLCADLLPAMLLGPIFGAAADRWSRKRCAIAADLVRVVAFGGIALVDSFGATIAFAVLAGSGTGLFTPAALAALPSVIDDRERLPAATSLYGAVDDLGFILGPAIAGAVLLVGGSETLLMVNAATFALSALLLAPLRFGRVPPKAAGVSPATLLQDARDGLRAIATMRPIRALLILTSVALFGSGLFNVAELFFAKDDLGTSNAGFSALVACFGIGFVCGSLAGSKGGAGPVLKRRYLTGLLIFGLGFCAISAVSWYSVAILTFAIAGFGNGLIVVYERLLIQASVADSLVGRVFGVRDALTAWAFALAFLSAGGLLELIGPRELILIAGGIGVATCAIAVLVLRNQWTEPDDLLADTARAGMASPKEDVAGEPVAGS